MQCVVGNAEAAGEKTKQRDWKTEVLQIVHRQDQ